LTTVMLLEAGFCFVLRIIIGQYASKTTWRRRYLIPVLVAAHLDAAIKYIGVAGLNTNEGVRATRNVSWSQRRALPLHVLARSRSRMAVRRSRAGRLRQLVDGQSEGETCRSRGFSA
ncbi:hypothetical protein PFISCL1PPCAC_4492, partial [Pristionchus fissidentatus]